MRFELLSGCRRCCEILFGELVNRIMNRSDS